MLCEGRLEKLPQRAVGIKCLRQRRLRSLGSRRRSSLPKVVRAGREKRVAGGGDGVAAEGAQVWRESRSTMGEFGRVFAPDQARASDDGR